jgi:hypothetical protein
LAGDAMRFSRRWSLDALLMAVLFVAFFLVVWKAFPVVGVRFQGTDLLLRIADDSGPHLLPDEPYLHERLSHPEIFFPHQYVRVSALAIVPFVVVAIGLCIGAVWALRRWRTRRDQDQR